MNHPLELLHPKALRCKKATLACLVILIVCYIIQFIWVAPNANTKVNSPQWGSLCLYVIPLLLFTLGIYFNSARAYAWFCFILMLYFCDSVISAFAIPHALGYLGVIESITIAILFTAAMYATKWYGLIANDGVSNRSKNKDDS
ncbi:MAG: hypothetical protein COA99_00980 [Moraxellaceae bacterium]|nr:MAG: hypothetical protein COA99_00980 [Moraxellaceae bacterium]